MLQPSSTVYFATLKHEDWELRLAATDVGLCNILLPKEPFDSLEGWIKKSIPDARLIHSETKLQPYAKEIREYFMGQRTAFFSPLDLRGTPFQVQVWRELLHIPFGQTRSYSEIATNIGRPRAVRAVGGANGANPIPIIIPCHRVIGKNGTLTGYSGGLDIKTKLLNFERYAQKA